LAVHAPQHPLARAPPTAQRTQALLQGQVQHPLHPPARPPTHADFGLSTTLGPTATHVSNYKSGTPYYCAPEVSALGRTTKASDTYSMGVLL